MIGERKGEQFFLYPEFFVYHTDALSCLPDLLLFRKKPVFWMIDAVSAKVKPLLNEGTNLV